MDTLAFNLDVRLNSLFYKGDDERVTICFADFHRFSTTKIQLFIETYKLFNIVFGINRIMSNTNII